MDTSFRKVTTEDHRDESLGVGVIITEEYFCYLLKCEAELEDLHYQHKDD